MKTQALKFSCTALIFSLSSGCGSIRGGYVPHEALSPPATQLSDGLIKFGEDVKKESASGYKRKAREDLFRKPVLTFLNTNLSEAAFKQVMPAPEDLLCEPIYAQLRILTPIENTTAKATAIKSILEPPEADTIQLIKRLGTTYSINFITAELPDNYQLWTESSEDGKRCVATLASGDPYVVREYVGKEFAIIGALGAATSLWDSVWNVIKPAVDGALKNADLERRNKAIRDYFSNVDNVTRLKHDIERTEGFLEKEFKYEQTKTAGLAVVAHARLLSFQSSHWQQAIKEASQCKAAIEALKAKKTDLAGVDCVDRVFKALDPALDSALNAAEKYDESFSKTLPKAGDRLSEQVDTIVEIAKGNKPEAKALWAALLRYATLYNTVKDTGSEDSKKKIDDALKAFREAIK